MSCDTSQYLQEKNLRLRLSDCFYPVDFHCSSHVADLPPATRHRRMRAPLRHLDRRGRISSRNQPPTLGVVIGNPPPQGAASRPTQRKRIPQSFVLVAASKSPFESPKCMGHIRVSYSSTCLKNGRENGHYHIRRERISVEGRSCSGKSRHWLRRKGRS